MFDWLKKLVRKDVPEVAVQAHPLEVNPGKAAKVARCAGRIANLMDAIEQGDTRPEIRRSLATHQAALVALGHDVPETAEEARKIMRGES